MARAIKDEFLLQCISNYQPLYDKTCPGYKSVLQKENCWQSVAKSLDVDVTIVKSRFKALKEKYRRELAIEEKFRRSGAPANARPTWGLMSFFKFMYKHETPRTTSSNYSFSTEDVSSQEIITEDISELDNSLEPVEPEVVNVEHNYHFTSYSEVVESPARSSLSSSQLPHSEENGRLGKKRRSENVNNVDSLLKDVSTAINNISCRSNDKYEQFAKYLGCELKDMDKKDADELMENINLEIIHFKKRLRKE